MKQLVLGICALLCIACISLCIIHLIFTMSISTIITFIFRVVLCGFVLYGFLAVINFIFDVLNDNVQD